MKLLLKNANIYSNGSIHKGDLSVLDASDSMHGLLSFGSSDVSYDRVIPCDEYFILPGFTDVHVHFREPGFSYKETIATGSKAAAHGGYTAVCTMPNLNPVPDNMENLKQQLDIIERDSCITISPYAAITVGEKGEQLSDMDTLAPFCCAFSDDGRGVQSDKMMEQAMLRAKALGKLIVAHCEDNSLLRGGYIHDGDYCRAHNHKGICSESEWRQIARDLELAAKTGVGYHVCHISTKESVRIIREAKKSGVDVTCETGPHYLLLNDSDLQEEGRFKMNPPLRSKADQEALLEGICDGTIDMIATDHAPHSAEEKSKGLAGSLMGVVGIETAFPLLYTGLVLKGVLGVGDLVKLLHDNPVKRFGLNNPYEEGKPANLTMFDLNERYLINPDDFLSMGRSTPFAEDIVNGRCKLTISNGHIAYEAAELTEH